MPFFINNNNEECEKANVFIEKHFIKKIIQKYSGTSVFINNPSTKQSVKFKKDKNRDIYFHMNLCRSN